MLKFLLCVFLLGGSFISLHSQKLDISELVKLSTLSSKSVPAYLKKKGYLPEIKSSYTDSGFTRYFEKKSTGNVSIELSSKGDETCIALNSASETYFKSACAWLMNDGYFTGNNVDSSSQTLYFQKDNLVIKGTNQQEEGKNSYSFLLEKKQLPDPDDIYFADDLLKFTSHEFLAAFFGRNNVKKDVYYFTEKQLKQCSVLFPNTDRQAIFIWSDEKNLCNLSYILISGMAGSITTSNFNGGINQNKWTLKNGIHSGMTLQELLDINKADFQFFGRKSDFLYMIPPDNTGAVDFRKTGLTLDCFNCSGTALLDNPRVSVQDAIAKKLAMYVVYIMVMPVDKLADH